MDIYKNYIIVLIDSLKKKIKTLEGIIEINNQQKNIASQESFDFESFDKSLDAKQELIDQLDLLDEGFEEIYNRVREPLMNHTEQYRDDIVLLRQLITLITDKTVKIQADEERNKKLIETRFASMKKETRQIKTNQKIVANYYKTMSKIDSQPQFLDKKK